MAFLILIAGFIEKNCGGILPANVSAADDFGKRRHAIRLLSGDTRHSDSTDGILSFLR